MWKSIICAVAGRAHVKAGLPCQDKVCTISKNDTTVIALCDGAGSAKLSHYGAQCTAQTVCDYLYVHFDDIYANQNASVVRKTLLETILSSLGDVARKMNCDIKELASTLLFIAIKGTNFIAGHIGDGVMGYLKGDDLLVASKPNNGEFINTTMFTTSSDAASATKLMKGTLNNTRAFVIMSDGAEVSFYDKRTGKLASVLKRLMYLCAWRRKERMGAILKEVFSGVVSKKTGDDLSIAFLVNADKFSDFCSLDKFDKLSILGLSYRVGNKCILSNRCIKHYDDILSFLSQQTQPITLRQMRRVVHLKPSRIQKYADRLVQKGIIDSDKSGYYL